MSRRVRAIAFAFAALACAALAAGVAGGYRADVDAQLGPLRSVVVARATIPARRPLRPADAGRLLEVRRVPLRFVPGGALAAPEQAIGRVPTGPIPRGAYLLATQLEAPGGSRHRRRPAPPLRGGRSPVQISVTGATALAVGGRDPAGARVDVIVTTEPGPGGGRGRTYVAAENVELLALTQSGEAAAELAGPGVEASTATLALTRSESLRLIQAENFARQVRLLPR